MSNINGSSEAGLSVVTTHPTLRERQLALAVVGVILVGFASVAPFADIPLSRLDSFIPSIEVIVSITSIITSVLLFGQFSIIGSRAVLVLAGGYLFVALIVVSHILTFPGAFSPTGLLGAGAQTAGWLYFFWHFGFPVAVIGYVLLKDAKSPVRNSTIFRDRLDSDDCNWVGLFADVDRYGTGTVPSGSFYRCDELLASCDLCHWHKPILERACSRFVVEAWPLDTRSVALCYDMRICGGTDDQHRDYFGPLHVGWYSGRAFAVLVTTIVMILMLAQTFALNARLMHLTMMLQRERGNKLANLEAVVASIAHEVRQPLPIIATRGEVAKRLSRSHAAGT